MLIDQRRINLLEISWEKNGFRLSLFAVENILLLYSLASLIQERLGS